MSRGFGAPVRYVCIWDGIRSITNPQSADRASMPIETDRLLLGHCGACETAIPTDRLLITYTTPEGWPRMYADCPSCGEVVRPV